MTEYEQAEAWLLQIPKFTKKNTPQATRALYERLGCPGEGRKILHVAGTNGKGSVCAFIESILRGAGRRTALFTSPHLVCMRERFALDGRMVDEQRFLEAYRAIREACSAWTAEGGAHPTFFEFLFFMGMWLFARSGAEYIILETGLGGRLDATNTVKGKLLTAITSIGLDHTEYLGNTLCEIAAEKAGILETGVPVVFWGGDAGVRGVIAEAARKLACPARMVSDADINFLNFNNKTIDFSFHTRYDRLIRLCTPFAAPYQMQNASLAAACVLELNALLSEAEVISDEEIRAGIAQMRWPGRMDEVLKHTYVDGAHNAAGMEAFVESLRCYFKEKKKLLLYSAVSDKDSAGMIRALCEIPYEGIFVAALGTERSADAAKLEQMFRQFTSSPISTYADVQSAFLAAMAQRDAMPGGGELFAVGSLYLAGEIYSLLQTEGGAVHDKF